MPKTKKPKIINFGAERDEPVSGLDPIVDSNTKILILGTFPAQASLDARFYYQNQIKRFWEQALKTIGRFNGLDHDWCRKLLLESRIGLWDIFECVERGQSSEDAAIRRAKYNDIVAFLSNHASIEHLVFNGRNAHDWLEDDYPELFRMQRLNARWLQSSSGRNTQFRRGADWDGFFRQVGIRVEPSGKSDEGRA